MFLVLLNRNAFVDAREVRDEGEAASVAAEWNDRYETEFSVRDVKKLAVACMGHEERYECQGLRNAFTMRPLVYYGWHLIVQAYVGGHKARTAAHTKESQA